MCRDKSGNLVIILKDKVSWGGSSGSGVISTKIGGKNENRIVSGNCREIKGSMEILH